jgi:hypothetical protein
MPSLFNRPYTPAELRQYAGKIDQLAGIRLVEYADGKARGLRAAEVWTGSGLRFTVWLDRSLDIGPAEFGGTPLAWLHPAFGAPAFYEPDGLGWLRTFGGGLLTTCGLTYFGHPDQDSEERLGLHGRISHLPAENVQVTAAWRGDDYVLAIHGQVRQSVLFGEDLLLTRRIETKLGARSLTVSDTVENVGYRDSPHMLLYHCNFGFPVVSPDTNLVIDDMAVEPRDPVSAQGLASHTRFEVPQMNCAEQVFFHHPRPDATGLVTVALVNRALEFGAYLRYRSAELPYLTQWKMMGAGEYVCALEPTTNHELTRSLLRERGQLLVLAPGETRQYQLEIGRV